MLTSLSSPAHKQPSHPSSPSLPPPPLSWKLSSHPVCRMLNFLYVALPFRIKPGVEIHLLTALLGGREEYSCQQLGKAPPTGAAAMLLLLL